MRPAVSTQWRSWCLVALSFGALLLGACEEAEHESPSPLPDGSVQPVPDGSMADAGTTMDGGLPRDGGSTQPDPDGGDERDGSIDLPLCDSCFPQDTCHYASCDPADGMCHQTPVANGAVCGEGMAEICVAGACVTRGCGDGYREPGPEPMREGCDDGNTRAGDLCSPTCEASVYLADADLDYDSAGSVPGPTLGVDGHGRMLLVWLQNHHSSEKLVARRFDASGAPAMVADDVLGEADGHELLEIDGTLSTPSNAGPVVAGLAGGGWVVAWTAIRMGTRDVLYRLVQADGSMETVRVAHAERSGTQDSPQAIGWGEGFVLGWHSALSTATDPDGGVQVRVFGADGLPQGSESSPATVRTGTQSALRLARSGDTYMALWVHQSGGPVLRGRRFGAGGAIDAFQLELLAGLATQPALTGLGDGAYAFAWRTVVDDFQGDIRMRTLAAGVPATLGDVTDVAVTPNHAASNPAITRAPGGGVAVSWNAGWPSKPTFAISADASPGVSELALLEARVGLYAKSRLAVAESPLGVLFAFEGSAYGFFGGVLTVFLLPFD